MDGGSVIITNVQILLGFVIMKLIVLIGVTRKIAVSRKDLKKNRLKLALTNYIKTVYQINSLFSASRKIFG